MSVRIEPKTCGHWYGQHFRTCDQCRKELDFGIYQNEKRMRWRAWQSIKDTERMIAAKPSMGANAGAMIGRDRDFIARLTKSIAQFHISYGAALLILLPFTASAQCECIGSGYDIVILPNGAYLPSAVIYEISDTAVVWKNGNEVGIRAIQYIASQAITIKAKEEQHAAEVEALVTANEANSTGLAECQEQLKESDEKVKRLRVWAWISKIGLAVGAVFAVKELVDQAP